MVYFWFPFDVLLMCLMYFDVFWCISGVFLVYFGTFLVYFGGFLVYFVIFLCIFGVLCCIFGVFLVGEYYIIWIKTEMSLNFINIQRHTRKKFHNKSVARKNNYCIFSRHTVTKFFVYPYYKKSSFVKSSDLAGLRIETFLPIVH